MAFKVNDRERLSNKESYFFSPKHRIKGNADASIWTVCCQVEYGLADNSILNGFIEPALNNNSDDCSYNLYKDDGKIQVLGYNIKRDDLKIAKYVKSAPEEWHGYPADHIGKGHNKPKNETLKNMADKGVITKREMSLISRGKKL